MHFQLRLVVALIAIFGAIPSEAQRRDTGTRLSLRALRGVLEEYATLAKLFQQRDNVDRLAGCVPRRGGVND
jgi:hypothetical protein